MKKTAALLVIFYLYYGFSASEEAAKVYEGIAVRSKAGLVVAGVMITSLPESDMVRYAGKYVRVKGYVKFNHQFRVDENDPVKKQGFNMPLMYKVLSIDIVDKR